MSYVESGEVLDPIWRVLRGTFDFRGRARRSDGVLYYIGVTLLITLLGFAVIGSPMSYDQFKLTLDVIGLLAQLPLVAWFVRRAHDYNLSGFWLLPLLSVIAIAPIARLAGLDVAVLQSNLAFQALVILAAVGLLCAVFWKPTEGDNRFGPNPRFDAPDEDWAEDAF